MPFLTLWFLKEITKMTTNNSQVQSSTAPETAAAPAKVLNNTNSVLIRMAAKYGCDTDKFYNTLKTTCFRVKVKNEKGQYVFRAPTEAEFLTLLVVAEQLGLNPMLGELYAFPDKAGGIVPIVGVNGWRQIAASNPEYAGVRFEISQELETIEAAHITAPSYISTFVKVRRPDGFVFESQGIAFFSEKFRGDSEAWRKYPRQMLLNKSLIQALKNAFPSCAGLYDDDDASAMASAGAMSAAASPAPSVPAMDRTALDKKLAQVVRLAKARNAWDIATDWAADNCAGDDLKYALAFITKARTEEVEEAKVVQPKQIEVKEPAKPVVKPTYAAPRQPVPLKAVPASQKATAKAPSQEMPDYPDYPVDDCPF